MPTYAFEAVDASGQAVRGVDTAQWIGEVKDRLRRRGLTVVGIREFEDWRTRLARFFGYRRQLPSYPITVLFRQLATMVKAGVPLSASLENLVSQGVDRRVDTAIWEICQAVSTGSTLSGAFEKQGGLFPPVTTTMIRAGENSGRLDEMLERVAAHLEAELALQRSWRKASAYPLTVFSICSVIALALVTYVFPRFIEMFRGLNIELPLVTRAMVTLTETAGSPVVLVPLLGGLLVSGLYLVHYASRPLGRRHWDLFRLQVPYFGHLARKIALARVARTLGLMLESGVNFLPSLRIAGATVANVIVKDAISRVTFQLEKGVPLSESLATVDFFPAVFVDLVKAGEESGELPRMLTNLAEIFEQDTEFLVNAVTALVEPVMIALMGLLVLFVLLAVFGPVYQLMALF